MILAYALVLSQFTVGGTVVDSLTQKPVSKAKLTLTPASGGAAGPAVITGPDGRFRFPNQPAGKFTLAAERLGYPRQTFGQHKLYNRYSSAVITGADQKTGDLTFGLLRGGVITGKVSEPGGEPVAGMTVYLLQIAGIGKGRRVARYYQTTTDDRGIYRVAYLPEGKFAIIVLGKPQQQEAHLQTVHVAYPPTYFPASTSPDGAGFVEVKPGQEAPADVTITRGMGARLTGQIAGTPSENRFVYLNTPALYGFSVPVRTSPWLGNNGFTMEDLPPGRYIVTMMQDSTHRGAIQTVDVSAPETAVTLNETPPALVAATVKLEGPRRSLPPAIRLQSLESGAVILARSYAKGVATFDAVLPGRYEVFATVERKEAAVIGVTANGVKLPPDSIIKRAGNRQVGAWQVTVDTAAVRPSGDRCCATTDRVQAGLAMLVKRTGWETAGAFRFDQSDTDGSFLWERRAGRRVHDVCV